MKAQDISNNIPKFNAKSEQWIQFHKDLKSNYGKKVANSIWIKAWGVRGNSTANNSDLREYLGKNGIKIDESAWDSVVDVGGDITDFFGDIFTAGKWVGIGLGVILIGGLGMFVFNIAKKPAQAIGQAGKTFIGK